MTGHPSSLHTTADALKHALIDLKASKTLVLHTMGGEPHGLNQTIAMVEAALSAPAVSTGELWQPIETAPRDGRELLMTDGEITRICYPKRFPRPIFPDDDMTESRHGDVWEYFRDDENAPGHSWSMEPTHWMPIPAPPTAGGQHV